MLNPFFTKGKVTNFEEAQTSDTKKFAIFFWEMIKKWRVFTAKPV